VPGDAEAQSTTIAGQGKEGGSRYVGSHLYDAPRKAKDLVGCPFLIDKPYLTKSWESGERTGSGCVASEGYALVLMPDM
jgi:hypothetical protein